MKITFLKQFMIMEKTFRICSEEEMKIVSLYILKKMNKNQLVLLKGELGSGKTTLVRSFAKLNGIDKVMSPTFNFLYIYENEKIKISHADLYRIESIKHVRELNLEETIEQSAITFIEWAENAGTLFDVYNPIRIEMEFSGECREVRILWQ